VKERRIALIYQLAKEVWFYEAFFPINILGYLLEPFYLRCYRKEYCITISESSRKDLQKLGYHGNIPVLNPGIFAVPLKGLPQKESSPTLIYVGRLKKSKRVHHILKAFQTIQKEIPQAKLWIVGSGDRSYQARLEKDIHKTNIRNVTFFGYVDENRKMELMRRAQLILVTSVREGWGIIVIEAAAMGTPAVVYNVPGLRDSVQHDQTGLIVEKNQIESLAKEVIHLLNSSKRWDRLAREALKKSNDYRWDSVADQFLANIEEMIGKP
jgi:glycosyltransferase involved in cell wall biosynthesis